MTWQKGQKFQHKHPLQRY